MVEWSSRIKIDLYGIWRRGIASRADFEIFMKQLQ
jgi:hypothetical protein